MLASTGKPLATRFVHLNVADTVASNPAPRLVVVRTSVWTGMTGGASTVPLRLSALAVVVVGRAASSNATSILGVNSKFEIESEGNSFARTRARVVGVGTRARAMDFGMQECIAARACVMVGPALVIRLLGICGFVRVLIPRWGFRSQVQAILAEAALRGVSNISTWSEAKLTTQ